MIKEHYVIPFVIRTSTMDSSSKTGNPTTEGDLLRPRQQWDHSSESTAGQNKGSFPQIDEVEDDVFENEDGNLGQHEPLLSPSSEKLQALTPRKTVQFGPFKKSKTSTDDTHEHGIQPDTTDNVPKQDSNRNGNDDVNRNMQSNDELGAPQSVSSTEPRVSFYPENVQVEITNGGESELGSQAGTAYTSVDSHENKRLIKGRPKYPRYKEHRKRKTWDAISKHMKKNQAKALEDLNPDRVTHQDWKSSSTVTPESGSKVSGLLLPLL